MRVSLLGFATFVVLGIACSRGGDEQKIRDAIGAMQTAVEVRKPREFMRYVDADFTGSEAGMDRDALHNLLRAQVLRNEKIGVTLGPVDVDLQGNRATAKFTSTLTSGSSSWIPERGAVYSVSTGWKKSGGEWTLINAMWEQTL